MGEKIRFNESNISDEDSNSESEYTEGVKKLLASARKSKNTNADSEEELYAFSESDSDSGDGLKNADSDIEGAEDDDLPDKKAWGRHKGTFYSTDYVDQDYGGFTEQEEKIAEREEVEARAIQERLAKELDEQDFTLDIFYKKPDDCVEVEETFVKADLTNLSQRQKLQIFLKESPEFNGLVEDFKDKIEMVQKYLKPIKELHDKGVIETCLATDYVLCHYNMILNYCNNILFYLLLKSKRMPIQNHPVVKRLYQYRQLLVQIDPIFKDIIRPQIEDILDNNRDQNETPNNAPICKAKDKSKKLKLIKTIDAFSSNPRKKVKLDKNDETTNTSQTSKKISKSEYLPNSDSEDEVEEETAMDIEKPVNEESGKRGITYQIAKNKGLMPKRKKEQRNPRVKHRNKFRKAKIRRKGAIREVRTEISRYGGELSGIKASVKKSIKIK